MNLMADIFDIKFTQKIKQLTTNAIRKGLLHPVFKNATTGTHHLVDKDTIPYKTVQDKRPVQNERLVVIAGALRLLNDPWDMARNPETNDLEFIIASHKDYILLTCPNCRKKSRGFHLYTTEKHIILYCHFCELFSWKNPQTKLSF